jgi:hypothetical protein
VENKISSARQVSRVAWKYPDINPYLYQRMVARYLPTMLLPVACGGAFRRIAPLSRYFYRSTGFNISKDSRERLGILFSCIFTLISPKPFFHPALFYFVVVLPICTRGHVCTVLHIYFGGYFSTSSRFTRPSVVIDLIIPAGVLGALQPCRTAEHTPKLRRCETGSLTEHVRGPKRHRNSWIDDRSGILRSWWAPSPGSHRLAIFSTTCRVYRVSIFSRLLSRSI